MIPEKARKEIVDLYMNGMTVKEIVKKTGISRMTVRSILKAADALMPGGWTDEDRAWLSDCLDQLHKELETVRSGKHGKYRVVHAGDEGIRTPYRPDGKFR